MAAKNSSKETCCTVTIEKSTRNKIKTLCAKKGTKVGAFANVALLLVSKDANLTAQVESILSQS